MKHDTRLFIIAIAIIQVLYTVALTVKAYTSDNDDRFFSTLTTLNILKTIIFIWWLL